MDILLNKKDVDVLTAKKDLYFSADYQFDYKDGFNVAVAFTAYDSNPDWILDSSIGEIYFNHFQWGPNEDGEYITERKRLNHHNCTREELGLEGKSKNHRFYPLHAASEGVVDFYSSKFICLEEEDLSIYGDYNTDKAR